VAGAKAVWLTSADQARHVAFEDHPHAWDTHTQQVGWRGNREGQGGTGSYLMTILAREFEKDAGDRLAAMMKGTMTGTGSGGVNAECAWLALRPRTRHLAPGRVLP
jgi:hypothetical protein